MPQTRWEGLDFVLDDFAESCNTLKTDGSEIGPWRTSVKWEMGQLSQAGIGPRHVIHALL